MLRSTAQVARILGTNPQQVKSWAWQFKDNLSARANPAKGKAREFTEPDVLALLHVALYWEDNPDIQAIQIGLNREDHFEDQFRDMLYSHTPILQEPPEEINEDWTHGIVLNGGGVDEYIELAQSYRRSAEALLNSALEARNGRGFGYPVLYAFRHVLELYLKILGEIDERTHSLKECLELAESRHASKLRGGKFPEPIRGWILEFDKIDPEGTAFRYADDDAETLRFAEWWLDFHHLKFAMSQIFEPLDRAIRISGSKGKPARKRTRTKKNHP